MRKLIVLGLSLLATNCFAAMITCYSGGKEIYHGKGTDVGYIPGEYLAFRDVNHKYVYIMAECVIKAHSKKELI